MSYVHAKVTLTPGQIKKLQSKHSATTRVSITLKHLQLTSGPNKLSLTKTQLNHLNKAKSASKGTRIDFSAAAIKDMTKTGRIFPLLAAIPALISEAALAVAKASALGAVGTAVGMGSKKVTGKGIFHKEGLKKRQTRSQRPTRRSKRISMPQPSRLRLPADQYGAGRRLPGTPALWYPKR